MNGGKAMKFTEKETFPPADGLPLTSIYKYQSTFKKSTENEKFYKKIRVPLLRIHRLKDKLIHCNAANIVFFCQ